MSRDPDLARRHGITLASFRIACIGREIEKRGDGKRTFPEVRMGHCERRAVDDDSFHPEKVQIDRPRPPMRATSSTQRELDLEK